MGKYTFFSSCVNWPIERGGLRELQDVIEKSIRISWRTLIRHVPVDEIRRSFPDYTYNGQVDVGCFHIKDDWSVSFHRSRYRGRWCYYVRWSAIEFVWIDREVRP